jgi:predicted transposase YbfD/YdcC
LPYRFWSASNEIPAAQALLAELGLAAKLVTLDALHGQKKPSRSRQRPTAP